MSHFLHMTADFHQNDEGGATSTLLGTTRDRSRASAIVSLGLLATSLIAACQALMVVFLVGRGSSSDAFFASYSLYVPLAVLGTSLRTTIIPLLGVPDQEETFVEKASRLLSRIALMALAAGVLFALLAQVLAPLITGDAGNAEPTARATLLILAPAAVLQIYSGAASAALSAVRRFAVSVAAYVTGSAAALIVSVVLIGSIGIIGAPLGLLVGAVVLAGVHGFYLRRFGVHVRPRALWFRDAEQARLLWYLTAGVALSASQQLALAIALGSLSGEAGEGTLYAYAFYITGLFTNLSVVPLALVTLPDLVEGAAEGAVAMRRHLKEVAPFVFFVLAPMLAGFAVFGKPMLELTLGPGLSQAAVADLYEIALVLELVVLATVVFALGTAMTVALRRWTVAVGVAVTSVLMHFVAISVLVHLGTTWVAVGHALATTLAAAILLTSLFGGAMPLAIRDLARGAWPAFALSAVFPLARLPLGEDPGTLILGASLVCAMMIYGLLALRLWPRVAGRFLAAITRFP